MRPVFLRATLEMSSPKGPGADDGAGVGVFLTGSWGAAACGGFFTPPMGGGGGGGGGAPPYIGDVGTCR